MTLQLDKTTTSIIASGLIAELGKEQFPDQQSKSKSENIAVVGLGYVGLPLATHLAARFHKVIGIDTNLSRIRELQAGFDGTDEVSTEVLSRCGLRLTNDQADLADATFYIVTVPTPISSTNQPNLDPLRSACRSIGPHLSHGDVVVFESTVYPGVTEDICGPLLEELSGLISGTDFHLGYSPERINPGDKVNTVDTITKIIAADCPEALDRLDRVYGAIVKAGLYRSPSIKVAEGAKVLENTQRDINIALMNELSLICDKLGIMTKDVIDAAATKWNFIPFTPGLVGGHCIGVDPYYLASLAQKLGLHPQVILAGRRMNDGMVGHVCDTALRMMIQGTQPAHQTKIGVFGISFKENVPDIRNSKALELVQRLLALGLNVQVHDPICDPEAARAEGINLVNEGEMTELDMMIVACSHDRYQHDPNFLARIKPDGALLDLKGQFAEDSRLQGRRYWSL